MARHLPKFEKTGEKQGRAPIEEYHISEFEDSYDLTDISFDLPKAPTKGVQNDPRVHIISEADYAALSFIDNQSLHYEVAFGIETQDRSNKIDNREYDSYSISPFMAPKEGGDVIRKYSIPVTDEKRFEITANRLSDHEERQTGENMIIKALNGDQELFEMNCIRREGNGWTYIARQLP